MEGEMFVIVVYLCILVLSLLYPVQGVTEKCDMITNISATNITMSQLTRRWFTYVYHTSPEAIGLENVVQVYLSQPGNDSGPYAINLTERLKTGDCVTSQAVLSYADGSAAEMIMQKKAKNTEQFGTIQLKILETDYLSFVLLLYARDSLVSRKPGGVWVWSRNNYLERLTTAFNTSKRAEYRCLQTIVRHLQNQFEEGSEKECNMTHPDDTMKTPFNDTNYITAEAKQITFGPHDTDVSNWKLFAIVAGVVTCIVLLFGGAYLIDRNWKTGYLTLQ